MNSKIGSLLSDFFLKFHNNLGFTALFALVFERTHRSLDLGCVSVAMIVPALAFTSMSNFVLTRFQAIQVYRFSLLARAVIFTFGAIYATTPIHFSILAGITSLFQQVAGAAKLTYDGKLIPSEERTSFNSKRAFLANIATIVGFSLGGALVSLTGGTWALSLIAILAAFAALLPTEILFNTQDTDKVRPYDQDENLSTWRYLLGARDIFVLVSIYVIVIAVLEMEAPLVFPFVKEMFGLGGQVAGYLLGACGVGGLIGAVVLHVRQKPFTSAMISAFIVFDGLCLFLSTLGLPIVACFALFSTLGIVGSVTLVSVETVIQEQVPSKIQPVLFSLLQFAGGVGGASLALFSTGLSDIYSATLVLRYSAIFETMIGLSGVCIIVFWQGVNYAKSTSE